MESPVIHRGLRPDFILVMQSFICLLESPVIHRGLRLVNRVRPVITGVFIVGEPRYSQGIKTVALDESPITFSVKRVGEPRYSQGIKTPGLIRPFDTGHNGWRAPLFTGD